MDPDLLPPPSPSPDSPMPDTDSDMNNNRGSGTASPEIPLTLSASLKVVVKFKAVGSAPALQQDVCKISAARKFEEVVRYLRRKLRCSDTDSVFLYVNSAFAPSLDEVVGNLHQCFKNAHDQLVVAYSITPAFG
ncbi:Ubiquitin-like protein [Trichoderma virens]|nr:Ubiquitin-like protein [Trichoderma virens]